MKAGLMALSLLAASACVDEKTSELEACTPLLCTDTKSKEYGGVVCKLANGTPRIPRFEEEPDYLAIVGNFKGPATLSLDPSSLRATEKSKALDVEVPTAVEEFRLNTKVSAAILLEDGEPLDEINVTRFLTAQALWDGNSEIDHFLSASTAEACVAKGLIKVPGCPDLAVKAKPYDAFWTGTSVTPGLTEVVDEPITGCPNF